ncbi:hypothetical protein [Serratia marcescens]|uniref:hypothetical protein n=1 Tax=Serratia marcescens TaxID=615 RepID=UPI000AE3988C|nr:hypothetical protein [Serratia marcescens]
MSTGNVNLIVTCTRRKTITAGQTVFPYEHDAGNAYEVWLERLARARNDGAAITAGELYTGDRKDSLTFGNKPESYNGLDLYNRITDSINERLIRVVGSIGFHSVKCGRNALDVSQKNISSFNVSLLHSFRLFLRQRKII